MKHSDFENKIIKVARTPLLPRIRHWSNLGGIGQRKGTADLACFVRGTFVAIEVKTPGYSTLTKEQSRELDAVRLAGGSRAGVVRTIEDLETLVEGIPPVQLAMGTHLGERR